MPDMRDELEQRALTALIAEAKRTGGALPMRHSAEAVLDSIPPGSFKNEKNEWVRLEWARDGLYTEVDHAE